MKVGIYCIENTKNGKKYIGQSSKIEQRWSDHKTLLKYNSHYNIHLQNAYNKYGENALIFKIIEECSKEKLDEREMYWISKLNTFKEGYNRNLGGSGHRGWKMSKEQISYLASKREKKIFCFENGCKKEFKSLKEASNFYDIEIGTISKNLNRADNTRYVGKRIFVFPYDAIGKEKELINLSRKLAKGFIGTNHSKGVYCLNNKQYYKSARHAAKMLNLDNSSITKVCKKKNKHTKGYVFMYYEEYCNQVNTEVS